MKSPFYFRALIARLSLFGLKPLCTQHPEVLILPPGAMWNPHKPFSHGKPLGSSRQSSSQYIQIGILLYDTVINWKLLSCPAGLGAPSGKPEGNTWPHFIYQQSQRTPCTSAGNNRGRSSPAWSLLKFTLEQALFKVTHVMHFKEHFLCRSICSTSALSARWNRLSVQPRLFLLESGLKWICNHTFEWGLKMCFFLNVCRLIKMHLAKKEQR